MRSLALIFAASLVIGCVGRPKPTEVEAVPPPSEEDSTRRITIVFGGDVMQHMPQVEAARRDSTFDYTDTFQYLKPFFDTVDLVVLNLETTISATGRYSGYPLFASPPEIVTALRDCGVDAVVLANNHIADRGLQGVLATVDALDKADMRHTGVFTDSLRYRAENPLMLEANGVRLALLNYTYGLNGLPIPKGVIINLIDTTRIASDLAAVDRSTTDVVVVFFHWGQEYTRQPDWEQRSLAAWCRHRGADIVIGSHPHTLQSVELHTDSAGITRGVTAYSLGNLVSNQRKRHTDGGMLLRLKVEKRGMERPTFDVSYLLTWVHTPIVDSRRRYVILPSMVADTLLEAGSPPEAAYRLFERDSRKLLEDSVLREVVAF